MISKLFQILFTEEAGGGGSNSGGSGGAGTGSGAAKTYSENEFNELKTQRDNLKSELGTVKSSLANLTSELQSFKDKDKSAGDLLPQKEAKILELEGKITEITGKYTESETNLKNLDTSIRTSALNGLSDEDKKLAENVPTALLGDFVKRLSGNGTAGHDSGRAGGEGSFDYKDKKYSQMSLDQKEWLQKNKPDVYKEKYKEEYGSYPA